MLTKLHHNDGSFSDVQSNWQSQCKSFGEELGNFAPDTMNFLAEQTQELSRDERGGVFALKGDDEDFVAVARIRSVFLPGFNGRVLRVRHVVLSPKFDLGEYDEKVFSKALYQLFNAILNLSEEGVLTSPHIKIHFRSPADVAIFREFSQKIQNFDAFSDVKMLGAWLTVTK